MNGNEKNNLLPMQKDIRKFLFVSWESLSGDLAWQIKKEGHEVKIYVKAESDKDVYDGFLEKVDDWKKYIDWADVVVFDDVGFGQESDELRKKGKLVVGGTAYTDKLEEDREFGQAEMKRVGMLTLPHWDFSDYDLALKFIEENLWTYPQYIKQKDGTWHLSTCGWSGNEDIINAMTENQVWWSLYWTSSVRGGHYVFDPIRYKIDV